MLELFLTFMKIGLFTFGGGYAMIANIREEISERKKWLDESELLQIIAIAESTPGPIAINLATYVGYKRKGVIGSIGATLGVVLPSVVIIYIISRVLDAFMANKYVAYAFTGIKCAVAFLILKAGTEIFLKLPKKALQMTVFSAVLVVMLIFEIFSVDFSSIFLILIGGMIGIISCLPLRKKEDKK